jgi:hypothetical protein
MEELKAKLTSLKEFISKCNTNDLLVFIHEAYIDEHNPQRIHKDSKVGIILKVIDSLKNGTKVFELKYIIPSKFKSKFMIEDPHMSGKAYFTKHIKNQFKMKFYHNGKEAQLILNSYTLILNSTLGERLIEVTT